MIKKIKKILGLLKRKFFVNYQYLSVDESEISIKNINNKIKNELQIKLNFVNLKEYKNYFQFLEQLGLVRNFLILTNLDKMKLVGNHLKPLLINKNNDKIIIFCHGITGNR